MLYIGWGDI